MTLLADLAPDSPPAEILNLTVGDLARAIAREHGMSVEAARELAKELMREAALIVLDRARELW